MTNREVISAWRRSRPGRSGHLESYGKHLYSYGLCIGFTLLEPITLPDGSSGLFDTRYRKVVLDHRAPRHFESQTTSAHVGWAAAVADDVTDPPAGHGWGCFGVCSHIRTLEEAEVRARG